MSGTLDVGGDPTDEDELDAYHPDDVSMFGFVLVAVLTGYGLAGAVVLLLAAYSLLGGWTLYAGQPYWAAICWPMGAVGLLTPAIMKLDDVTEVERTPPVLGTAILGYGAAAAGLLGGWLLSFYPIGLGGAAATVSFTVLSLKYVRER